MQKKVKKRLLTGGILVVTTAILSPALFWGYIMASYWTLNVNVETPEPWDGCVDPRSAVELAGWINTSEATGEPLCDSEVVNMTFPEDTEEPAATDPLPQ